MFTVKLHKLSSYLFLLFMILLPLSTHASIKEITTVGEYNMSENETLAVAKERAYHNAMRKAVEQSGIYIESYTQTLNSSVSKDEINMIAGGIVEVTDKKFDRKVSDTGGDFIKVTITCKVDTDNVQSMMNKLQDKFLADNLKKIQLDYDIAMQEVVVLKQELARTKTVQERKNTELKIFKNEQFFTAIQWIEKGYDYMVKEDNHNAIDAFSKAIQLNPQDARIYAYRGCIYESIEQYELAINDFDKAIELKPDYVDAYRWRGGVNDSRNQYDLAITDYNKAIRLNPQDATAYYSCGIAYAHKGQYVLALADFSVALKINPQYTDAYFGKAMTYMLMGHNSEAIQSFKLFIQNAQNAPINHSKYIETAKSAIIKLGGQL